MIQKNNKTFTTLSRNALVSTPWKPIEPKYSNPVNNHQHSAFSTLLCPNNKSYKESGTSFSGSRTLSESKYKCNQFNMVSTHRRHFNPGLVACGFIFCIYEDTESIGFALIIIGTIL